MHYLINHSHQNKTTWTRYLIPTYLAASWQLELICSFYFLLILCWTDSGTDGLVCCVTVFFPSAAAKLPHVSCVLSKTVGSGIRLSVLPVLLLTGLGNCFTGSCQIKEPPSVNEGCKWCQRQAVFIYPARTTYNCFSKNIILQAHIEGKKEKHLREGLFT